jgi:hypothetical protein
MTYFLKKIFFLKKKVCVGKIERKERRKKEKKKNIHLHLTHSPINQNKTLSTIIGVTNPQPHRQ